MTNKKTKKSNPNKLTNQTLNNETREKSIK
jgi:hypothetical protein